MNSETYPAWSAFSKRLSAELEKRGSPKENTKVVLARTLALYLLAAHAPRSLYPPGPEEIFHTVINGFEKRKGEHT